ncbi:MAG: lysophospholipid acyltransferase family protein [Rickettsiales bacterium]
MSVIKKIIKSEVVKNIACKLAYVYIKFVLFTSKLNYSFKDFNFEEYKNQQCILATWHGRVLIMPIINPFKLPACAIVSDHNDGRLIGKIIQHNNIELIYGSSSKKRLSSLKEILVFIRNGYNFLITPDGPRGPAKQVKGAIINIASNTGIPIIPAICSAKSAKIFNSWDKFMLPLPFSEISIIFSKPIQIPKNISMSEKEQYEQTLNDSLNNITDIADQEVGRIL